MSTYKIIHTILRTLNFLLGEEADSIEKEKIKNDIESLLDDYEDLGYLIDKLER